ncbi:hypothetical protein [Paraburkholderia sp. J12]|uniref:hypothetical protein n=1 Tax=Paraburkholderia sp. J12 TaxID=2805432 RepID=UPI002ABDE07B|nr:hypothetical protein [Paraburkholderia sp. J12]
MTSIISLQLLPIVLILFGGVVALMAPAIESLASPCVAHRHKIMLVFGGLAAPLAVMGLLLLAVHVLLD